MSKVRDAVNEALNNAYNGGYRDDVMRDPVEVAEDLCNFDSDIEAMFDRDETTYLEVAGFVRHWQAEKNTKPAG